MNNIILLIQTHEIFTWIISTMYYGLLQQTNDILILQAKHYTIHVIHRNSYNKTLTG